MLLGAKPALVRRIPRTRWIAGLDGSGQGGALRPKKKRLRFRSTSHPLNSSIIESLRTMILAITLTEIAPVINDRIDVEKHFREGDSTVFKISQRVPKSVLSRPAHILERY